MGEDEIALAQAYLAAADNDPIAALIRSVKDVVHLRRDGSVAVPRPNLRLVSDRAGRASEAA